MKLQNKTFDTIDPPKSTVRVYAFVSLFRDSLFEFISLFMLLYVQLASPIAHLGPSDYVPMFFTISMVLIGSRILAAFCWTFASHVLDSHHYRLGRYRTFMLFGSFLTTITFLLMFFVSPLASGWGYVACFLVFYTLMECVYSINDISYWSFINTLSSDEGKKGRIAAIMNLFIAIGTYTVASIAPAVTGGDAKRNLTILATVLISCYFVSQIVMSLTIRERAEPDELSQKPSPKKTTIFEPMKILFKDHQIQLACLCTFLIFLAQDCLIGNASDYFFYEYGYGSFSAIGTTLNGALFPGGITSFIFTICFGVGIAMAQLFYPFLASRLHKKGALFLSLGLITFSYLFLFFYAFLAGHEIALFITAFLLAFGHGIAYMVISMNAFDSSEYYEYRYQENKNAPVQSLKAFPVIIANGAQTGIFYLFLAASTLLETNGSVANLESLNTAGEIHGDFIAQVNAVITSTAGANDLTIYRAGLTLFPLVISALAILLSIFTVKVNDEKKFQMMVNTIAERKAPKA
jgi:Na+/melibiose symporter-like transporter